MSSSPPPLANGWVKSKDKRGRTFYANLTTRQTQWNPPAGWVENAHGSEFNTTTQPRETSLRSSQSTSTMNSNPTGNSSRSNVPTTAPLRRHFSTNVTTDYRNVHSHQVPHQPSQQHQDEAEPPLPSNWEKMTDRNTGKSFYVDHVNRQTTWVHPGLALQSSAQPPHHTGGSSGGLGSGPSTGSFGKQNGFLSSSSSSTSSLNNGVTGGSNRVRWDANDSFSATPNNNTDYRASQSTGMPRLQREQTYTRLLSSEDEQYNPNSWSNSDKGAPNFSVVQVRDEDRAECPGCGVVFSMPMRRRHHCRLCGDVFCDSCSTHRCLLPLEGPEFEKPVRVCDLCFVDVEQGNYFSMRRYLTPLQLFDPNNPVSNELHHNAASNVSAALASLASDLDSVLLDSASFQDKVTIPAHILVPSIARHLNHPVTSDRAIRALSTLLALGSVVGDDSFAHAVYAGGDDNECFLDMIMQLLEQSGASREVIRIQEQATRLLFYLSDCKVISSLLTNIVQEAGANPKEDKNSRSSNNTTSVSSDASSVEDNETLGLQRVNSLDIHRALRNMLDHATSSSSPSLQRWAAACIRNLVTEDQRRACLAAHEFTEDKGLLYESFTSHLVSTGGVIILCSLIGADDADTRAHATAALSATIVATRTIGAVMSPAALSRSEVVSDESLISAIVGCGGCGPTLAQLLLSADDTVADMGCSFASFLVLPILKDPMQCLQPSGNNLNAYHEAAFSLANEGGCLPALIQLLKDSPKYGNKPRPIELKRCAMEALAAVSLACCSAMKSAIVTGDDPPPQVTSAIANMEDEAAAEAAYTALDASSSQSLISSRDSPSSQLREAAGIALSGMVSFSVRTGEFLRSKRALFDMLSSAGEDGMLSSSTLRGEWAPRCLGLTETASYLLLRVWEQCAPTQMDDKDIRNKIENERNVELALDCLLEVLDSGALPLLSKIIASKINFHEREKTIGEILMKVHACRLLSAMFGIASCDKTSIGQNRLNDAIASDPASRPAVWEGYETRIASNIVTNTISLLQSTSTQMHNYSSQYGELPLAHLTEASLLAVSNMCGAPGYYDSDKNCTDYKFSSSDFIIDPELECSKQENDACVAACSLLFTDVNFTVSPMLVGAFGESCVVPALRLCLAVVLNGTMDVHLKIGHSGILIPIADLLHSSFLSGARFTFSGSLALLRYCGPYVTADSGEKGGLFSSVRQSATYLSRVLMIPEASNADKTQLETVRSLKVECIYALEALSHNASLWSAIASAPLPAISEYFLAHSDWDDKDGDRRAVLCAGLRTVQNVIPLPSHARSAALCGFGTSLSRLICGRKDPEEEEKARSGGRNNPNRNSRMTRGHLEQGVMKDDVQLLALEVLHTLASHSDARRGDGENYSGLIHGGTVGAACFALGRSASDSSTSGTAPSVPMESAESITKFGLELLHYFWSDLEQQRDAKTIELDDAATNSFVDTVSRQSRFIRALCATMLLQGDTFSNDELDSPPDRMTHLYGPPLALFEGPCSGYPSPREAAIATLFSVSAHCSTKSSSPSASSFWSTFFMEEGRKLVDRDTKQATKISACAIFLTLLMDEEDGICVPRNPSAEEHYFTVALPNVRRKLLEELSSIISNSSTGTSAVSMVEKYKLPNMCLSLCSRCPNLIEPACCLIKVIETLCDKTLPSMLSDEFSLRTMFHLISSNKSGIDNGGKEKPQRLVFDVLSDFADQGILGSTVERFGMRSFAIDSLSAACQVGRDEDTSCNEEHTDDINKLCMRCLAAILLPSESLARAELDSEIVYLSATEAKSIAFSLGRTISSMVIARFVERAKLLTDSNVEDQVEKENTVTVMPEVILLCALASKKESLPDLYKNGGLEALSLVAMEGDFSAIKAMHEASKEHAPFVLNVEGHLSIMEVLTRDKPSAITSLDGADYRKRTVETFCLELLANLCNNSRGGILAVANSDLCSSCIDVACHILCRSFSRQNKREKPIEENKAVSSRTCEDSGNAIQPLEESTEETNLAERENELKPEKTEANAKIHVNLDSSNSSIDPCSLKRSPLSSTSLKNSILADMSEDNFENSDQTLQLAALSFLTEIVRVKSHRAHLLQNADLLEISAYIAGRCVEEKLKYQATQFLVAIAPSICATKITGQFSAFSLANVFCSILRQDTEPESKMCRSKKKKHSQNLEDYQVLAAAAAGLEYLFDFIKTEEELISDLSVHFSKLVDSLAKSSATENSHQSGLLCCNISTLFLSMSGVDHMRTVLMKSPVVLTMLRLIMNYPVSSEDDPDVLWNVARTQSLQCIAGLMHSDSFSDVLISSLKLISSQEDLTNGANGSGQNTIKPGDSLDGMEMFLSVLGMIYKDKSNPVSSVAARRIVQWIGIS